MGLPMYLDDPRQVFDTPAVLAACFPHFAPKPGRAHFFAASSFCISGCVVGPCQNFFHGNVLQRFPSSMTVPLIGRRTVQKSPF